MRNAEIQERYGGEFLMATLFGLNPFLLKLYAGDGCQGQQFQHAVKTAPEQTPAQPKVGRPSNKT